MLTSGEKVLTPRSYSELEEVISRHKLTRPHSATTYRVRNIVRSEESGVLKGEKGGVLTVAVLPVCLSKSVL